MKGYLGPGPGTHVCFNFSIASVWSAGGVWKAWAWNQCTYYNFPVFQYEVEEEYERPRTSVPTYFNFPLLQYEVEEEYERPGPRTSVHTLTFLCFSMKRRRSMKGLEPVYLHTLTFLCFSMKWRRSMKGWRLTWSWQHTPRKPSLLPKVRRTWRKIATRCPHTPTFWKTLRC